jgi:two-component system sensor histidine kinase DesK
MEVEGIAATGGSLRSIDRSGATDLQEAVTVSGISPRLWRLYAQAWLVCLLFPILTLVQLRLSLVQLLLPGSGLLLFVACYTAIMWAHPLRAEAQPRWSPLRASVLLAGLAGLVLIQSLRYGGSFLWVLVGVSAMAGVLLPARSAFVVVMVLTLLTLGSAVGLAGGLGAADWLHIIPLVLLVRGLGLDMAGMARLSSALREVHAARGELARMAVVEERLRMARDLHDLLGHNLAMITLKSELAQRLVNQDPTRAAQEMREVEQAARQTLREVRLVVAGAQQPRLATELDNARQLLGAAGIACMVEPATGALPSTTDAILAWTVREGVTNVIRHSRASWCRIQITATDDGVSAEITNDGAPAHEQERATELTGTGLVGLAGRIATQGGRLSATALNEGFRLWVELPLEHRGSAEREVRP